MSSAADALPTDQLLAEIAGYVNGHEISSDAAYDTARYSLIDSIGCALEALDHPGCEKLLGPMVPGASVTEGARVPGTRFLLDPVTAAFNIGCMVRWTDFSDTWVAPQTTHPSDDVGAILAVADYLSRVRIAAGKPPLTVRAVLEAMIKAHELQGVLGMGNIAKARGIDHTLLVRVACAPVVTKLLGGSYAEIVAATSLAFFDVSLCVHRFGSNTGPRKSWAAADAASQAVRLAMMAVKGEPGYPQVLSHPKWGFSRVFLADEELQRGAPFGSFVMENVLFKIVCPVVIHAQSAIECALKLHPAARGRLDDISVIKLRSHRRTLDAIDKTGPLRNAADRDHCLQYAVAVALLHGKLTAEDYEDEAAADPRIDKLRSLMTATEDPRYTESYLDPARRANPNSIEVCFRDGTSTGRAEVEYPVGHPRRREEGIPLLIEKFEKNLSRRFPKERQQLIRALCLDHERLMNMPANEFTDMFTTQDTGI